MRFGTVAIGPRGVILKVRKRKEQKKRNWLFSDSVKQKVGSISGVLPELLSPL